MPPSRVPAAARRPAPAPPVAALLAALLVPGTVPAADGAPRVVADIAPVASLVAQVMGERGAPVTLVEPGASPHDRSMRPSAARALTGADVVVRTADGLTPWLPDTLRSLAPDAVSVELLGVPGSVRLAARDGATFAADGADRDDHGHGEDDDDAVGSPAAPVDPHAWLDPENARVWLDAIAGTLADADPDGADVYRANAARARAALDALEARVRDRLAPVRGRPFAVAHDDLRYFEARFDMPALGAVVASDAAGPGPARLDALRGAITAERARCVFTEPGSGERLARTVAGDARVAELDPLGARLEPGPALYAELLEGVADALADCLA